MIARIVRCGNLASVESSSGGATEIKHLLSPLRGLQMLAYATLRLRIGLSSVAPPGLKSFASS